MADITFEHVLELAEQLTPDERAQLIERLQATLKSTATGSVTREMILAEFERRKAAGAFEHVESLYGKYAVPGVEWSQEEIDAYLHEIGTEWEKEMDELSLEEKS
jgi:hypothetical protein